MLNHIVVMGRLTRDPELRQTQSGDAVCSFSIACERDFKTKDGRKETDFIDCTAWRNTAEFVSKYFAKGRMAIVEGRLQLRDWTDKEGSKRRSAEIVASSAYFGDSKPKADQEPPPVSGGLAGENAGGSDLPPGFDPFAGSKSFEVISGDDGELPF